MAREDKTDAQRTNVGDRELLHSVQGTGREPRRYPTMFSKDLRLRSLHGKVGLLTAPLYFPFPAMK